MFATAVDALAFVVGWFTKFPEYQKNDVYILGESYAGKSHLHLPSTLVHAIISCIVSLLQQYYILELLRLSLWVIQCRISNVSNSLRYLRSLCSQSSPEDSTPQRKEPRKIKYQSQRLLGK